ncbi:MAG: hypothetical protein WAX08_05125, partial [Streptococcus suis]
VCILPNYTQVLQLNYIRSSITEVSKEGLSIETSILKDGATINFDKELEKAKSQYEEVLKDLIDI